MCRRRARGRGRRTGVACGDSGPRYPLCMPFGRARRPAMICRCRSGQRHNARWPAFEVRITYPFHPRCGEMASVVGRQHHGGAEHFVIRQPDTTLALLPAWMTQPDAAGSAALVAHPRLPPGALAALRALVDTLLVSSDGDSPRRKGAGHGIPPGSSTGSVQAAVKSRDTAGRRPDKAATAVVGAADGSGARMGDGRGDGGDQ